MTEPPARPRRGRLLTAHDIRRLLGALNDCLLDLDSRHHQILVAGGAALALMWEDRSTQHRATRDIDVLEHRFRSPPERRTGAVDLISMRFPKEMVRSIRLIAELEDLPHNWLNTSAAIFTPDGDMRPRLLYQGECLTVQAPCAELLLAMKLYAAREHDLEDATRLAHDAAITEPAELVALVASAYGADAAEASTRFAAQTAQEIQRPATSRSDMDPDADL